MFILMFRSLLKIFIEEACSVLLVLATIVMRHGKKLVICVGWRPRHITTMARTERRTEEAFSNEGFRQRLKHQVNSSGCVRCNFYTYDYTCSKEIRCHLRDGIFDMKLLLGERRP